MFQAKNSFHFLSKNGIVAHEQEPKRFEAFSGSSRNIRKNYADVVLQERYSGSLTGICRKLFVCLFLYIKK